MSSYRGHTDPAAQYVDRLAGYDVRLQMLERGHGHEPQTPVGAIVLWGGGDVPPLWLACDGRALFVPAYPDLFAWYGYTWGGAGEFFNLPNMWGRVPVAAGSGVGVGLTPRELGAVGGTETVVLTAAETGAHHHVIALTTAGATADHVHGGTTQGATADHVHGGTTGGITRPHVHNMPGGAFAPSQAGLGSFGSVGDAATAGPDTGHEHPFTTGNVSADHGHPYTTGNVSADHGHTIPATNTDGGGTLGAAHENMPPFVALYMIVKALPSTAAANTALTIIEKRS